MAEKPPAIVVFGPACPQCGSGLAPVRKDPESMLNDDQFDSVRAGDYYCTTCPQREDGKGGRASTGYCYWWNSELFPAKTVAGSSEGVPSSAVGAEEGVAWAVRRNRDGWFLTPTLVSWGHVQHAKLWETNVIGSTEAQKARDVQARNPADESAMVPVYLSLTPPKEVMRNDSEPVSEHHDHRPDAAAGVGASAKNTPTCTHGGWLSMKATCPRPESADQYQIGECAKCGAIVAMVAPSSPSLEPGDRINDHRALAERELKNGYNAQSVGEAEGHMNRALIHAVLSLSQGGRNE